MVSHARNSCFFKSKIFVSRESRLPLEGSTQQGTREREIDCCAANNTILVTLQSDADGAVVEVGAVDDFFSLDILSNSESRF